MAIPGTLGVVMLGLSVACTQTPALPPAGSAPPQAPPSLSRSTPPEEPERPDAVPAVDVPDILQFSAPAVGGGQINGEDYAGHDLAMWFWAPW